MKPSQKIIKRSVEMAKAVGVDEGVSRVDCLLAAILEYLDEQARTPVLVGESAGKIEIIQEAKQEGL